MTLYNRKIINVEKAKGWKLLMKDNRTSEITTLAQTLIEKQQKTDLFGFQFFNNIKNSIELYNLMKSNHIIPHKEFVVYEIDAENIIETGYTLCNGEYPVKIKEKIDNTLKAKSITLKRRYV